MRSVSGTRRLLKWVGNGLLVVMLVWTLVPFYWMIVTSLKKDKEIYGFEATLVPRQPTLANYTRLFATTPFMKYVRNSTIIAVGTTIFSLVSGCLGAYALARLRFPGRGLIARGLTMGDELHQRNIACSSLLLREIAPWLARTTPARTWRSVRDGRPGTPMAGWKPVLSDSQTWDVVAYLHAVGAGTAEPSP